MYLKGNFCSQKYIFLYKLGVCYCQNRNTHTAQPHPSFCGCVCYILCNNQISFTHTHTFKFTDLPYGFLLFKAFVPPCSNSVIKSDPWWKLHRNKEEEDADGEMWGNLIRDEETKRREEEMGQRGEEMRGETRREEERGEQGSDSVNWRISGKMLQLYAPRETSLIHTHAHPETHTCRLM